MISDAAPARRAEPGAAETTGAAAASQSRGSSFYAGMRILPQPQREAMYEVYSFCRAVDDIADDGGPAQTRNAALLK